MASRLRAPAARKPIVLRPVRPSIGLRDRMHRELQDLIDEMQKSLVHWIGAAYRANQPEIAQDKSPAAVLREVMKRLRARWEKRFDEAAKALAVYFSTEMAKRSDVQLRQILKDGGFSVQLKMTKPMNDVMQATIGEQVGLIKSIAQQHLSQVEGLVMRSVTEGRDLYTLSKELRKRYQVTSRRAALIARDQNNKATATLNRVRQLELGITEAIWMHSHAGKEPRPEHVKWGAQNKRYDVAKGMWSEVDQAYVWPGTAINCRCTSRPVIKGLEDD